MEEELKNIGSWLTPAVAYAALAAVGLKVLWEYVTKKKKDKSDSNGNTVSGGVDMASVDQIRADIQRIFDKIDELQRTVLENYATKEEVEVLRVELRDIRDKVIRLEADRDAMSKQIAALPKREGDRI